MKHNSRAFAKSNVCRTTPEKVSYLKVAFAWKVGARQMKATGVPLFIYQCDGCHGWHLTHVRWPTSVPIETHYSKEHLEPKTGTNG